jgi:uncharacterized protein
VVADVAADYCGASVDPELVRRGALLHDIGRSVTHSIAHAQAGAALCREMGLDEELCRIPETHTGAGLSSDECTLLGLSPVSCVPETLEEKIVAHADNLVRGSKVISLEERMMRIAELPGRAKRKIWRLGMEVELLSG